jgi:carbonic anhydrase
MDDRRTLLRRTGVGLFAVGAVGLGRALPAAAQPPESPGDPLRLLADGNARFAAGAMTHPHQDPARRAQLADRSPQPFAVILSCLDSRTAPEILFDRGLGDLLVTRTVDLDYPALAAQCVEYGPLTDATALMVVLGHQHCATVTTAVAALESGTTPPPGLNAVVHAIRPAYLLAKATHPANRDELVDATTMAHTRLAVAALRVDPTLAPRVRRGRLTIRGAYYAMDTGTVAWPDW